MKPKPSLALPVTSIGVEVYPDLRGIITSIEYKGPHSFVPGPGTELLFESPCGIIADEWVQWVQENEVFEFLNSKDFYSYACDLGPSCRVYRNVKENGVLRSYPETEILTPDQIIELAIERVSEIRKVFHGILKFEIFNYFPTGVYEHVCNPEFISEFLNEVGGELLLDLAHARVSAENLGLDFKKYLLSLPLDKVSEVHLSKPGIINEVWEDSHELPGEEELEYLDLVLANAEVKHLVVEYYQDPILLTEFYYKLNKHLKTTSSLC